jgi:hypothetical protein
MSMMSLDNTLWLVGILTEAVVVGLLVYRRVWRLLPVFCIYCAWDVLSNAEGFASSHIFKLSYSNYIFTYLIQTVIDSVLQFCVLVELMHGLCCARFAIPFHDLPLSPWPL